MKHFSVPYLDIEDNTAIGEISRKLDHVRQEIIDNSPWDAFPYKPQASFAIAYGGSNIFLKFFVEEKHVRAVFSEPNQPVYKDSCVEFFVSFGDEPGYYNFEFNCAGTCLLSFGEERANRKMTSANLIKSIAFQSSIKPATNKDASIGWELTLVIPFDAFQYHEITSMKGKKCRANFYKCGDDLPEPHFLAWNTINTEEPDFHRPEFFGNLEFN
jgi:hypothetical protein